MASNRQKQKRIQKRKAITSGKNRKRLVRSQGTTPKFPVHPDKPSKQIDKSNLKLADQNE